MTSWPIFDCSSTAPDSPAIITALRERGFAHLRGMFPADQVASIVRGADEILKRPAIAGSIGYAKIDHPKRVANPMLIGDPLIRLVTDERVLGIIESYMESGCVLAEAILKQDEPVGYEYFPIHADFSAGWKKSRDARITLSQRDLQLPVGVGGVLYLHETVSGAFCYCAGTHTWSAPHGQQIARYPTDLQRKILDSRIRLEGRAGDLILFDDRGFHGPDQPASAQRTVILLDYYRVKTFGQVQVAPMLVYTRDLAGLNERQLRVLGVGAEAMVRAEEYLLTRFRRNRLYPLARWIVDNAFIHVHLKQHVKKLLGVKPRGSGVQI